MTGPWAVFRRVGLRHLRRRPLRTLLTTAGVVVGVALVLATALLNRSVDEGVRAAVRQVAGVADLEVASITSTGMREELLAPIASLDEVEVVAPVVRQPSVVAGPVGHSPLLVIGLTPDLAALGSPDGPPVELTGHLGSGGVVLTDRVARRAGVALGDEVSLRGAAERFAVTGLLSGGALELVNGGNVAVMPLEAAQRSFGRDGVVDAAYVGLAAGADRGDAVRAVEGVVGAAAAVSTPEDRVRTLMQDYAAVGGLTSLMGMIALVVALLVVHNSFAMAVTDRRRELAVALALGTRHRDLTVALIAEGAVLGAVGAAGGIALGWLLAHLLLGGTAAIASEVVPITAEPVLVLGAGEVAVAAFVGVCACIVGAATAARRIGSVQPTEALRAGGARQPYAPSALAVRRAGLAGLALLVAALGVAMAALAVELEVSWLVHVCVTAWLVGTGLLVPWIAPRAIQVARPVLARAFGAVGRLAGDGLAYSPTRTTVSIAALALTLGMVLGIAGSLRSYESELRRNVEEAYTASLYVVADDDAPGANLAVELADHVAQLDGVGFVSTMRFADMVVGGHTVLAVVEPVRQLLEEPRESYAQLNPSHRIEFAEAVAQGDILISRLLAQRLGIDVGDQVSLPTPDGAVEVAVGGIVQNWGPVASLVIDRATYTRHWHDTTVHELRIHTDPTADLATLHDQVAQLVTANGLAAHVLSQAGMVDDMVASLAGLLAVADSILLVALLVAGLTIMNTAFAAIAERRWQLGMVRAVGTTRAEITRALLLEAAVISVIGVAGALVVGALTGLALTAAAQDMLALSMPFRPSASLVALTAAAGIAVTALATLAPRYLADRQSLIDSLRFE